MASISGEPQITNKVTKYSCHKFFRIYEEICFYFSFLLTYRKNLP